MSDHDSLADDLEQEADRLEEQSEQLGKQGESARAATEQAQQDEFTPAPMGERDPAHRESPEGEGEEAAAGEGGSDFDPEDLGVPPQGDSSDDDDGTDDNDDAAAPRA